MKEEKFIKIVADVFNLCEEDLTLDSDLSKLTDWDSLSQVMVLSELQEQLGINISVNSAIEFYTIRDLMKLGEGKKD